MKDFRRRGGFTLIELLVVVAIIGILVAIAIPAFGNALKDSQKKADAGKQAVLEAAAEAATMNQAEAKSDTPPNVYVDIAISAAIENALRVNDAGAVSAELDPNKSRTFAGVSIDSTAPPPNNARTEYIKNALAEEQGLNLDAIKMLTSWAVTWESGKPVYWISDQDISTVNANTCVRVIRYNSSKDTYTAGYMKVVQKTAADKSKTPYNAFNGGTNAGIWSECAGQTTTSKKSYDETLAIFNTMNPTK